MIKSKEELYGTYIDNTDKELVEMFIKNMEHHNFRGKKEDVIKRLMSLGTTFAAIHKDSATFTKGEIGYDHWGYLYEEELEYRKLTLEDLKEEENTTVIKPEQKQVKELPPKYKYTPVESESIFDLKEPLESGNLFTKHDEVYFPIHNQLQMMKIIVEDCMSSYLLYTREEIKWQDEVENYLLTCNDNVGMFDVVYGNGNELSLGDEDFLEAARIALRTIGEL